MSNRISVEAQWVGSVGKVVCQGPEGSLPEMERAIAYVLEAAGLRPDTSHLTEALKALSALTNPEGHIWHGGNSECTGECKAVRKVLGYGSEQAPG